VLDNRGFYRWEKVFSEMSSFRVVPGKAFILKAHEVVYKCPLGGPKEIGIVDFVDKVPTL